MSTSKENHKTEWTGQVEAIIFTSADRDYAILTLSTEDGTFTCKGGFFHPERGQMWHIRGEMIEDPRYGEQIRVREAERVEPSTEAQLQNYLEKGKFEGVGPKTAENLVALFGTEVIDVILHRPQDLLQIKGLSEHKIERIREQVLEKEGERQSQMFLQRLGLGPKTAAKIIDAYGLDVRSVIETNPYQLIQDIDGIGFSRADRIALELGIDPTSDFRLRAAILFHLRALTVIRGNSYTEKSQLLRATTNAILTGIPKTNGNHENANDAEEPMDGFVFEEEPNYFFDDADGNSNDGADGSFNRDANGNSNDDAVGNSNDGADGSFNDDAEIEARLLEILRDLLIEQEVVIDGLHLMPPLERVYLKSVYDTERRIAQKLIQLNAAEVTRIDMNLSGYERENAFRLGDSQRHAVEMAADHPIVLITGGPGTGKTTILKAILKAFDDNEFETICAAPTGKAAKRMEQSTGRPAQTIHRMLGYKGGEGKFLTDFNEENPLIADAILIDEASMLDMFLMDSFLEAVVSGTRLIFVGDIDQLPPVQAGNVLKDMIASKQFETADLREIYRQAEGSLIIKNAHEINRGHVPEAGTDQPGNDFFVVTERKQRQDDIRRMIETEVQAADVVLDLVTERLPKRYGFDSKEDIQVLCLGNKGACGVEEMNNKLQAVLNPANEDVAEIKTGDGVFRVGDKVMQIKNDYKATWLTDKGESGQGVYNGDFGVIEDIDPALGTIDVDFDGRKIAYERVQFDALKLAYAITVHKSQGSEFRCVVMPLFGAHPLMNRNLLYTGVTRASHFVALVSTNRNLLQMVRNVSSTTRQTALVERIAFYADMPFAL